MNPLKTVQDLDPELTKIMEDSRLLAFTEGSLDLKTKYLIGLSIDATKGTPEGVRSLAIQALKNGATKDEIKEVIRIVYLINGVSSMYPVSIGLKDLI
ncbi:MAG: carboxymuconolactone decarboxylase family protein [Spirochaetaceae bacterium]